MVKVFLVQFDAVFDLAGAQSNIEVSFEILPAAELNLQHLAFFQHAIFKDTEHEGEHLVDLHSQIFV